MLKRYTRTPFSIALGCAFLLQAATSIVSGTLYLGPFGDRSDIAALMHSTLAGLLRARIATLLDVVTALGIVWLAVMLFRLTKRVQPVYSTLAFSLYLVEAGILLVSKVFAFGFIQASVQYANQASEAALVLARALLSLKEIAYTLHMLPCGVGAVLFYALLARSGALPQWLPLWGLVTIIPVWLSSLLKLCGLELPFWIALPYAPFEFFAGACILLRGLAAKTAEQQTPAP
jgi:Domain of unknown function (DUF4386)